MSIDSDPRSADADAEPEPDPEPEPETTPARFARTVAMEWIQPPEPRGGWTDYATLEPRPVQTCLSVGRLVHDDDCVKILAGSAMIVGDDERVMLSGIIEIPARCVVRIVRLVEEDGPWQQTGTSPDWLYRKASAALPLSPPPNW